MNDTYMLRLHCRNRPGLIAKVAGFLAEYDCDITDAQKFDDTSNDQFFMRVAFRPGHGANVDRLRNDFAPIAEAAGIDWMLLDRKRPKRVLLPVSR